MCNDSSAPFDAPPPRADRKDEDERTKVLITDMFNSLWFGRAKITTAFLPPTSPEPEGLVSPLAAVVSPRPTPTPRRLGRATSSAEELPVVTPLQSSHSAPGAIGTTGEDVDGAPTPRPITLVADRSIAQIVDLVASEDSTGWLYTMIRRLLYGGDDVGDPRMADKKVWSCGSCGSDPSPSLVCEMALSCHRKNRARNARC